VDNRTFKRLVYEVLEHDPTSEDVSRFFLAFREVLSARGLLLRGITTDGSPLYPEAIQAVFGDVRHQVCEFHVLKEINKAILKAVAQVRRELSKQEPNLPRGRPMSPSARKAARKKKRLQEKITGLFDRRHLFVQHGLTPKDRQTLQQITRGLPTLRHLRSVADEVYRLFDRRCRAETALRKLATLRRRIRRFQSLGHTLGKLFSPNIEKALTFLDDSLLPSTSNAVERANRRHRKMQKTIYRVRTREHIIQRIALDMLRDAQAPARLHTTDTLHKQRTCA